MSNFGQLLEQWNIVKLKREWLDDGFPIDQFRYSVQHRIKIFQFIDFVQQILQLDPRKRLTPLQALSHPFITGQDSAALPFMVAPDFQLEQLRNYQLA